MLPARPWWKEWKGLPAGVAPVTVGRAVAAVAAAAVLTAVALDGTPIVVLLAVLAFNIGGAVIAWHVSRRWEDGR
jgi:hypothetical protein